MSRIKLHVRNGDLVQVLAGDDRGAKGKVLQVNPKTQRALVEGLNLVKKHRRPTQENPEGGISEMEASIHVSNLKVLERAAKEAE